MKISVALCTYNGSRFLREQLESISVQRRLPDELIVSDDCSTDNTLEIVRKFSAKSQFPITILHNEQNLGSTRNFEKAIENCTGDVIALSDQDDVWLPQKLERIEAQFDSHPDVGLVFSDAVLTDDELRPIGLRLWTETFRPADRRKFASGHALDVLLQYNVVTGATIAFRSALRPAIMPIPQLTEFIHDGWIGLVAALCSHIRFIREPLIKYRQHSGQQLGAGQWKTQASGAKRSVFRLPRRVKSLESKWRISNEERYAPALREGPKALTRLDEFAEIFSPEKLERIKAAALDRSLVPDRDELLVKIEATRRMIAEHIEHIKVRASLPPARSRRLSHVLREQRTGRYSAFSRGWQSVIIDLVRK